MEQSASTSMDLKGDKKTRGAIAVHNVMKKDHAKPPENAHGLCLANPCRVAWLERVAPVKRGRCSISSRDVPNGSLSITFT